MQLVTLGADNWGSDREEGRRGSIAQENNVVRTSNQQDVGDGEGRGQRPSTTRYTGVRPASTPVSQKDPATLEPMWTQAVPNTPARTFRLYFVTHSPVPLLPPWACTPYYRWGVRLPVVFSRQPGAETEAESRKVSDCPGPPPPHWPSRRSSAPHPIQAGSAAVPLPPQDPSPGWARPAFPRARLRNTG